MSLESARAARLKTRMPEHLIDKVITAMGSATCCTKTAANVEVDEIHLEELTLKLCEDIADVLETAALVGRVIRPI